MRGVTWACHEEQGFDSVGLHCGILTRGTLLCSCWSRRLDRSRARPRCIGGMGTSSSTGNDVGRGGECGLLQLTHRSLVEIGSAVHMRGGCWDGLREGSAAPSARS